MCRILKISTIWFIIYAIEVCFVMEDKMKTSEMIRELCNKKNISVSELARRIDQTPQNFGKKLKRDTITLEELKKIADVMGVTFEQSFILPDGEQIKTGNNT